MAITTKFNRLSGFKKHTDAKGIHGSAKYLKYFRFRPFLLFLFALIGVGYYTASVLPIVKVCLIYPIVPNITCNCEPCSDCSQLPLTYTAKNHGVDLSNSWHPTNEFDVIPYDYIDQVYTLYAQPGMSCFETIGNDWTGALPPLSKYMVQSLIAHATASVNVNSHKDAAGTRDAFDGWNYEQFINGYRRWEPLKGMTYILDIQISKPWNRSLVKTIRASYQQPNKPLIVTRGPYNILTTTQKVNLTFVVSLYPISIQAHLLTFLSDLETMSFHKLSIIKVIFKLPIHAIGPKMRSSLEARIRKLGKFKPKWKIYIASEGKDASDPLMFPKAANYLSNKEEASVVIIDTRYRFKQTFLDRCWVNSERGQSIYKPIPFTFYNPDIVTKYSSKASKFQLNDIDKQTGDWYNEYGMNITCGYYKDLMQYYNGITMKPTNFQRLKVIIATDPGLIFVQTLATCLAYIKEYPGHGHLNKSYCIERFASFLGSKRQLAKFLMLQNYTGAKTNKVKG